MAAAFYNQIAGGGAFSAGTQPARRVYPEVVAVMKEEGIDLSDVEPRLLTDEMAAGAHILVTMGCGIACPDLVHLKREEWILTDPEDMSLSEVRKVRDEIKSRVEQLILATKRHGFT